MKKIITLFLLLASFSVLAQNKDNKLAWPREIVANEYTITLYQAQLESLGGNILSGRMALSIKKSEELVFGAMWFDARLTTDLDSRIAILEAFNIEAIKFPDVEDTSKMDKLKEIIRKDVEALELEMSLDHIIADLEDGKQEQMLSDQIKNDPPTIYFRTEPTVLALIDGEPMLKETSSGSVEYVVNTPFFIVKHKKNYYLKGGEIWYTSKEIETENWKRTKSIPKDVKKLAEEMIESGPKPANDNSSKSIPNVISTSKPSELIMTNGALEYAPINQTSLLYVKNTENDIIMDIKTQMHFVLINGRWYQSKVLADEAWQFVEPSDLPAEFSNIPENASIASVRVSVPGTPEAREAKYEQQMPQTAIVDRNSTTIEVTYDGEPKFEKIENTTMKHALNTPSTVIKLGETFYAVEDGIWFVSNNATGPWKVSDKRPDEVDEIPPSSPVYNVKYVYIYDSTPEVVYVGYTPGYYHSYYYSGVVVYGTGWYYRPWYGHYYYPRPVTFGFGVHYNPYTGWGFSAGFSYGWFTASFHRHSYWGPCGYRHGYRHGYHHGYHRGYHNGYKAGYARGKYESRNVYKEHRSGVTTSDRRNTATTNQANRVSTRPSNKQNNMYTDRSGNIYKRENNGNWNQQNKKPATGATQPSTRQSQPAQRPSTNQQANRPSTSQPSTRPNPSTGQASSRPSTTNQQLNRDYQNRNRGTVNYNNYQRNTSPNTSYNRSGPSRSSQPQRSAAPAGGRRR